MAPTDPTELLSRDYCNGYYNSGRCRYSSWSWWGRWVFAGVVIVIVVLVFLGLACVNSRRRRKRGLSPRYGTGWMAPPPKYGEHQNNPAVYAAPPPPPQYSAGPGAPAPDPYAQQPGYNTGYGGYYGNNQYNTPHDGVQAPPNAYYGARGADDAYQPPPGPPPGK